MNDKPQQLILIRGLPCSGKTTEAKRLLREYPKDCASHYEADMFFEDPINKQYKFDNNKLRAAYEWCRLLTQQDLQLKKTVIVANNFIQIWTMAEYIKMAETLSIPYSIIVMRGLYQNTHRVPESAIKKMIEKWEPTIKISSGK